MTEGEPSLRPKRLNHWEKEEGAILPQEGHPDMKKGPFSTRRKGLSSTQRWQGKNRREGVRKKGDRSLPEKKKSGHSSRQKKTVSWVMKRKGYEKGRIWEDCTTIGSAVEKKSMTRISLTFRKNRGRRNARVRKKEKSSSSAEGGRGRRQNSRGKGVRREKGKVPGPQLSVGGRKEEKHVQRCPQKRNFQKKKKWI